MDRVAGAGWKRLSSCTKRVQQHSRTSYFGAILSESRVAMSLHRTESDAAHSLECKVSWTNVEDVGHSALSKLPGIALILLRCSFSVSLSSS